MSELERLMDTGFGEEAAQRICDSYAQHGDDEGLSLFLAFCECVESGCASSR